MSNPHGDAEVYLHGAHVTHWQPSGQSPVLWLSRDSAWAADKPIRGGIPICFPWFAAHATETTAPGTRLCEARGLDAGRGADAPDGTTLVFELTSAGRAWPLWPHTFTARYRVTAGPTLRLAFEVRNTGSAPFTFEEALHTYFAVQYVREITITRLEQTDYLDKVEGLGAEAPGRRTDSLQRRDRPHLSRHARPPSPSTTPAAIAASSSARPARRTTVVWNPWVDKARAMADFGDLEWPEMVCVETCNVNAHKLSLDPGASHVMTATIGVERL